MDILGMIPSFGGLLYTIIAFVVALSIIVAVHEYGHYIVGRWSGIHAEVFSLGFGPKLYSRVDRRGTRWQLALLPFGGYVKFLGDADAASGRDAAAMAAMPDAARRRSMHGAPLWARAATVAAGPLFNFILAVLIFAGYFMSQGVATDTPVVAMQKPTPDLAGSLLPGDRIVAINGTPTPDNEAFFAVGDAVPPAAAVDYTVSRNGSDITVPGPYPFPPIADALQPGSAAMAADLRPGDVIRAIDGKPIYAFTQLREVVGASDGRPLQLEVWRPDVSGGESFDLTLTPKRMDLPLRDGGFETRWLIGLTGGLVFEPETRRLGLIEAMGHGADQTWSIVRSSLSGIYHMVSGAISTCNLSGPIGIAETSGDAASQGAISFIWFIAVLSTAVGLMNLFPIPVLDGGHLVFHAYEAVTGRPPSDTALRVLMSVGLALLLGLMVFALGNDLLCP